MPNIPHRDLIAGMKHKTTAFQGISRVLDDAVLRVGELLDEGVVVGAVGGNGAEVAVVDEGVVDGDVFGESGVDEAGVAAEDAQPVVGDFGGFVVTEAVFLFWVVVVVGGRRGEGGGDCSRLGHIDIATSYNLTYSVNGI